MGFLSRVFAPRSFDPRAPDIMAVVGDAVAIAKRTRKDQFPNAPRHYPDWTGLNISVNVSSRQERVHWRIVYYETPTSARPQSITGWA